HLPNAPSTWSPPPARFTAFFRFNTAWGGGDRAAPGVTRLGELIREQLA
ncbi:PLP-dependent aminotransferase family protein, partial [Klebsiella pneumoniae]|nr:PLP-dependent aminotransferase family protein [Klebsiella pneumoniae]